MTVSASNLPASPARTGPSPDEALPAAVGGGELAAPLTNLVRASLVPLLIAVLPQIALATVSFGLPVLAPALMAASHRPPADYGWIGGAVGLGTVVFFLTHHALAPSLGPIGILRLGLLAALAGVGLILTGFWVALIVGAGLAGFGFATSTISGSQVLADFTPRAAWGTLFSLRQASVPVGGVVTAAVVGLTLQRFGWGASLATLAGLIAIALCGVLALPRRYNQHRPLLPFSWGKLLDPANLTRPFKAVRARPGFPAFIAAGCGLIVGDVAVTQFFTLYMVGGIGLPVAIAALMFAVMQVSAVLGRVAFGAIADWSGAPSKVVAILAILSSSASLLLALLPSSWPLALLLALAIIVGLTTSTWNGLYLAELARLVPAAEVSAATAEASAFSFLVYMVTPPLFARLTTVAGWRPAYLLVAVPPLLAGVFLASRLSWPKVRAATGGPASAVVGLLGIAALAVVFAFGMVHQFHGKYPGW